MARKLRGLSDRPSGVSRHSQGQVSRASMNRMFANAGEPSDGISCHSANPPNRAMKLALQPISATSNSFKKCRRSRTTRTGGTLGEISPDRKSDLQGQKVTVSRELGGRRGNNQK